MFIRSLAIVAFESESDRSSVVSRLKALINTNVDRKTQVLSKTPFHLDPRKTEHKEEANESALENMFSGGIPEGYSAEELARLKEIDKMVSADSKVNLKDAVDAYQTQLDNNGGTIQQIQNQLLGITDRHKMSVLQLEMFLVSLHKNFMTTPNLPVMTPKILQWQSSNNVYLTLLRPLTLLAPQ